MSDIVERLNGIRCEGVEDICYEAAAEIERLRAEVSALRANAEALCMEADGLVKRMRASLATTAQPRAADTSITEAELRRMMRDPRYWRTREPDFVKRVTEGFRKLAGDTP